MMRLRTVTPLVALALTLILAQAPLVSGAASYSLSISPNVPVSLGTGMTFTLTLSGATRNSAYTVLFDVVKPNGTGSALATKVITTNNRSEEHTSELQSHSDLVCRLLLEKKKKIIIQASM